MSRNKDSDQKKSNNKQVCSAKLDQTEFGANAPLIRSVYPCREISDLYCQVRKKNGRLVSLAGNWESHRTGEGDNTEWQGNDWMIVTSVITRRLKLTAKIRQIIGR